MTYLLFMLRCFNRLAQSILVVVVVAACAQTQQLTAAGAPLTQADGAGQSSSRQTSHAVIDRTTSASGASQDALAVLDDDGCDEELLGTGPSATLLPAQVSGVLVCHAQHAFSHERALTLERPPRG